MANTNITVVKDTLYPKVEKSLNNPENAKMFKTNIDKYMACLNPL